MRETRWSGAVAAALVLGVLAAAPPGRVAAVETDIAINTSAIDFGQVNVGASAQAGVTLTNTGGAPFGPINMFGGAPPTNEFGASQNCQGQTLPAGGSCTVNYSFSPGSTGTFSDQSNFTISQTPSQSQGEDFSVSLTGVGFDPNATTTTTDAATTTTAVATTTTHPTNDTTPSPTTAGPDGTAAESTTTTTAPTIWPLTGAGVVGRPALVVSIGNVDVAPQAGLNDADVVFEQIVEGRHTRFAAVFNSTEPNPVGPVAPVRLPDLDLLAALGDPAIAFADSADDVDAALTSGGFELLSEGGPGFFRDPEGIEPDNLYANLSTLFAQLASSGAAVPLFEYTPPATEVGGTPVAFVDLLVGVNGVGWTWDARQGLFLRSQLGSPHELTDGQATADNVVVLVVNYEEGPNESGPQARTVGTGAAFVYTAGQRIEGTWTRAAATDPFTLGGPDAPILLAPGRTWVELVDADHQLSDG